MKREELLKNFPVKEILCEIPEETGIASDAGLSLDSSVKEAVGEELEQI